MTRMRGLLFLITLLAFAFLAYLLRDVIYSVVIVPLAYTLWLLELLYLAVPQLVKWVLLIVLMCIGVLWKLIPDWPAAPGPRNPNRTPEGRVASLAVGLQRARTSNYFRWLVANRLGRLARRLSDPSSELQGIDAVSDPIHRYLNAGLNQSFVDFPNPRTRFAHRLPTPLDMEPGEIVEYLESRMETSHDGRTRRR